MATLTPSITPAASVAVASVNDAATCNALLTGASIPGISVAMATLLSVAGQKEAAYFAYQRTTLDPAEQRHAEADDGAAKEAAKREWDTVNDHFDMLVEQASAAQLSVCHHPVTTAADLRAKLAFIVQHQMGGGMDWNATLLADAERIAATPVIMPPPVADADAAWARAHAEWQAVRQDLQAKGLSDEQVDVLTEREMQAYCNLAELPLRGIGDAATKLQAMIELFDHVPLDPLQNLLVDMTRLSIAQPQGDDHAILDAFAGRRREFDESYHLEMTTEQSDAYFDRCDAYEAVIHSTSATTIAGVIAKLRVTFLHQTGQLWSDRAIMDPAHPVFVEGLAGAGMFVRQAWSAIEDLARIGGINLSEQGQ